MPEFTQGADSIVRLQKAFESVKQDTLIKNLLRNPAKHAFSISQRVTAEELETTKFQHYFEGVEVIGSLSFHHLGKRGTQVHNTITQFDLSTTPSLTTESAVELARGLVGDRELQVAPTLKILPSDRDNSAKLIYWVRVSPQGTLAGRDILIDAHSGHVVANLSRHLTLAPVQVYSAKNQTLAVDPSTANPNDPKLSEVCQVVDTHSGTPLMVTVSKCLQTVKNSVVKPKADSSSKNAAANSKAVLSYYQNTHGRNSYDNKGAEIVNIVHIGIAFDNAFWASDEKIMAYGDGDGKETGDFTNALDVAAHEITHAVTSETANLIYKSESGALNEAYSDFFGKMVTNDGDWAMGRKLFLDPNNKGFRDLENPGNLNVRYRDDNGQIVSIPYPSKVSEKLEASSTCDDSNDNCWVHVNATIPGHAAYLVTQAIGKAKAEKLYYITLTQKLHENSSFQSAARDTLSVCDQIYDFSTCSKVKRAFDNVGM